MDLGSLLNSVYVFAAVFGVGVTAVDMLGLLGSIGDHGASHDAADAGDGAHGHMDGSHDHDAGTHHEGEDVGGALLSVLRYLRIAVYFSLGFGPLGLGAKWFGYSDLLSLAWALPGGIGVGFLASALFRIQRTVVDSTLPDEELLFETAQVIIPISGKDMGRVRVRIGQTVSERYALAENPESSFHTGEEVQITQVTDECVYVRSVDEDLPTEEPIPRS